jgi:hypothetical protein
MAVALLAKRKRSTEVQRVNSLQCSKLFTGVDRTCWDRSLLYLQNYQDLTHRTARMEILADYDFKVQFLAGKKNVSADALSRIEWPYEECPWPQVDTEGEVCAAAAAAAVNPDTQTPVLDWVAEQGADEDISMLKQWLVAGRRPTKETVFGTSGAVRNAWANFEQFELNDDILCHVWTDGYLRVVPTSWRKTILKGHHKQHGHVRTTKVKMALRQSLFWFRMSADVDTWIKSCKVCRRRLPGNSRAPLVQEADSFFNQRIFINLKGPLVKSHRGMVWYLVCIDGWSKRTELLPLPHAEATTVYSAFYNGWICHHGVPVQLLVTREQTWLSQLRLR